MSRGERRGMLHHVVGFYYCMFELYRLLKWRAACRFCNFRPLNTNSSAYTAPRRDAVCAPNFVFSRRKLQNRQAARAQTYGISESPGACHRQCRFVVSQIVVPR
jgi:hypothetical protein